ncbi:MAG: sulfatase-like hydrolase/transferase [Planctomycetota bacterium]
MLGSVCSYALAGLTLSLLASCPLGAADVRPNILFILADDLGYADLPLYGGTARMPNIERLATEGVRFTRFYVAAPICSPSRCALLTGQYPQRHRISSYLDFRAVNEARGLAQWLDPAAPSVARGLEQAGYATYQVGKWHLGGQRDVGEAPFITAYGFADSLTQFEGLGDRIMHLLSQGPDKPLKPLGWNNDRLGRGNLTFVDRSQVTAAYVTRASADIDRAQQAGKPFYIQLWLDDPHTPLCPPLDRRGDGSPQALYRGVLEAMDEQLGPLLARIRDEPALRNNTLVVFASDNGPDPKGGRAGTLRGHKGTILEGGIRVPLISWGSGLITKPGSVDDKTVIGGIDWAPTVLTLAGVPTPSAIAWDGEDRSPALRGSPQIQRNRPMFWMRPPKAGVLKDEADAALAMRDADWKLITTESGTDPRLYDLATDPNEANNRSAAESARVQDMTTKLRAWRATLPVPPLQTTSPATTDP